MGKKQIVKPDVEVQFNLGSATDGNSLTNLWLETTPPEHCDLACSYCYADGGKKAENSLTEEAWISVIEQANEIGVKSIGIPGRGEPFHPGIADRTMSVLDRCRDLGIYVTLFSHGGFLSEDRELIENLNGRPLELMIKGNSLIPEVQDRFASNPSIGRIIKGYGNRRNKTLDLLSEKGFNDVEICSKYDRKSKMALVTSVMTQGVPKEQQKPVTPEDINRFLNIYEQKQATSRGIVDAYVDAVQELGLKADGISNYMEIPYLLAFARINNIIFDVDSVLERGRGATCGLNPADKLMTQKFFELKEIDQEVFGYDWGVNTTYVGVACERGRRHLYLDYRGMIFPCIGATGVFLGDIKLTNLLEAWDSPEMQIIRAKEYHGRCADSCANFVEKDKRTGKTLCQSCLGRCTDDLTNKSLLEKGYVQTIGCWNFREREYE